ncbi:reverse transcriptase/maturase family protein [Chitinophaga sp. S165]|uniref:reverse transcriptase/maturase family protein n=1 Tax=Chitinophaga sp. S165 TaxID=2135462 RepID=UPI000D714006|nr:reverse transcriptase/maturase family protein [Chitinophaga sp. S165]PWV44454.1 reverse transcriptase (RNA-dependent DNA polymerase) [Chitinophaga sp. S165]
MYSETLWNAWVQQEARNYEERKDGKKVYHKKGYIHFDPRIWFPDKHQEIKDIIRCGLLVPNPQNPQYQQYYSFFPFLKIITKTPRYRYQFEEGHYDLETKKRPICFAAHRDSLIFGYYSYALTRVYEAYIKDHRFDDTVLAYRSDLGKCNIQFAKEVFSEVKCRNECSAIALDIKGYFDNIDHSILLDKWRKVIGGRLPEDQMRLYEILTKYSYIKPESLLKKYKGPKKRNEESLSTLMDIVPGIRLTDKFRCLKKDQLIVTNNKLNSNTNRLCGIPQGSPISALLSNIFLIDFDADLKQKSISEGFVYRRYCDDILLICETEKAHNLMNFVIKKISEEYFLTIQPAKVDLIDFRKNSQGKIRGFMRPRKIIKKFGEKNKETIKESPAQTTSLNEMRFYKPLQYLGFEYNGKDILIRSSSLSRYYWKLNYRLQRTVIMSYGPKSDGSQIYLNQIYERYTHLGKRNFLSYAYNAAKDFYQNATDKQMEGMDSPAIKRQLRNHWRIMQSELKRKNIKWHSHKSKGKKNVVLHSI